MQSRAMASICWMLLLLPAGGCAVVERTENAVADVEQGVVETEVFALSATQADEVIRAAFAEGWPDKERMALGSGRVGYEIKLWFAIDREHIIGEALAAGDGFRFRVVNRGTAPLIGVPARKKLVELIRHHATGVQR